MKVKFNNLVINCDRSNILNKKYLKDKICKNYKNIAFTTIIRSFQN